MSRRPPAPWQGRLGHAADPRSALTVAISGATIRVQVRDAEGTHTVNVKLGQTPAGG